MEAIKKAFGILMLGMAIWLVARIVSPVMVYLLWGLLLFGIAFFLGTSIPPVVGFRFINRSAGLAVALLGMVVILNGVGGFNALNNIVGNKQAASIKHPFMIVHNIAELNQKLALAQVARKPVILDFYADWCESCVTDG